jgi:hypothetical protein
VFYSNLSGYVKSSQKGPLKEEDPALLLSMKIVYLYSREHEKWRVVFGTRLNGYHERRMRIGQHL